MLRPQLSLLPLLLIALFALVSSNPVKAQEDLTYSKQAAEARALAKKNGIPLSLAEIPKRNVPDASNAVTYLRQLQALTKTKPLNEKDTKFLWDEWLTASLPTPQQIQRARQIITSRSDIMRLVDKIVVCDQYYIPITLTKLSPTIPMPEDNFPLQATMRSVARWTAAKTLLLLAEGKEQEAVAYQAQGLHLTKIAQQDPSSAGAVVANVVDRIVISRIKQTLFRAGEHPGIAKSVASTIPPYNVASLGKVIDYEVASVFGMVEATRNQAKTQKQSKEILKAVQLMTKKYHYPTDPDKAAQRFINANEINLIQKALVLKSAVNAPYYQSLPKGFPTLQDLEKGDSNPDVTFAYSNLSNLLSLRTYTTLSLANRLVVQVGAQVLAWKVEHGKYPNSLAEMTPQVPLDPFDGKPLRYRKEATGFVVYSVGEGKTFDGVYSPQKWKQRESGFWYPKPTEKK